MSAGGNIGLEAKQEIASGNAGAPPTKHQLDMKNIRCYEHDMIGHAEQAVDKYLELSGKDVSSLKKVATPCIDDHQLSEEDFTTSGQLAPVAARIVLKILYFALHERPDLLWSVNTLAREVTRWNVACDKRLHRLISYMHCTRDFAQLCFVGDSADQCKLALYVDASFAGDLRDSKSTSGMFLALVGPNTFAPLTWFCKEQDLSLIHI